MLLDIGYKSEGVIPARELSIRNDVDPYEIVSLGEELEAMVLTKEDKEGRLVLSKKRAQYERAWGAIEEIKERDGVVKGPVIEVVKGGLILDIGLRGFLPASLVELRRVRDLAAVHRQGASRPRSSSSTRTATTSSCPAGPGSRRPRRSSGTSSSPTSSPARSARAWCRASSTSAPSSTSAAWTASSTSPSCPGSTSTTPASVVAIGDEVTVQVLDVDLDRERISLSLKATQQDPWQEFAGTHRVGELVYGRVTKLVPFGAFVQVGDGIEGLVHISEMSAHHVDLPDQVVTPGEELWVKIIDLDLQRRRISLSIKQAAEGGEVAEEYREHFGEHAYDDEGNYIGPAYDTSSYEEAWEQYEQSQGDATDAPGGAGRGRRCARDGRRARDRGGARRPTRRLRANVTPEASEAPEGAEPPAEDGLTGVLRATAEAGAAPKFDHGAARKCSTSRCVLPMCVYRCANGDTEDRDGHGPSVGSA